jgi:hypothetical protein
MMVTRCPNTHPALKRHLSANFFSMCKRVGFIKTPRGKWIVYASVIVFKILFYICLEKIKN